jgi:hypothetical protein
MDPRRGENIDRKPDILQQVYSDLGSSLRTDEPSPTPGRGPVGVRHYRGPFTRLRRISFFAWSLALHSSASSPKRTRRRQPAAPNVGRSEMQRPSGGPGRGRASSKRSSVHLWCDESAAPNCRSCRGWRCGWCPATCLLQARLQPGSLPPSKASRRKFRATDSPPFCQARMTLQSSYELS